MTIWSELTATAKARAEKMGLSPNIVLDSYLVVGDAPEVGGSTSVLATPNNKEPQIADE